MEAKRAVKGRRRRRMKRWKKVREAEEERTGKVKRMIIEG